MLRISGGRTRKLVRGDGCPLQPLDGQAHSARAIMGYEWWFRGERID